jgi:hypothetical protein
MMRGSRSFIQATIHRPGAPVPRCPRYQRMGNGEWRMHMSPTASGQAWSGENLESKTAKSARPPDAQPLLREAVNNALRCCCRRCRCRDGRL